MADQHAAGRTGTGAARSSRLVGVLGGMGPRATVDFYDRLVRLTPAATDQEHLRVVIWADPTVPSRQDAILRDGTDPTPWLVDGVTRLVDAGADLLVVPCNTVHRFVGPAVPDGVEFISIIDVTVDAVGRRGRAGAVGLLATDAALVSDLFQAALREDGRDVVLPAPADQAALRDIVEQVKANTADANSHRRLLAILDDLTARGAAVTIAGCTEISALLGTYHDTGGHDVVDPSEELAIATVDRAFAPAPALAPRRS